jgi:hypothetical protein
MALGREHMPWARALPFVLYLNSSGQFVHGTAGALTKEAFKADLEKAAAP